jgi:hypothetical protein
MNADFNAIYAKLAARHGAATVLDKAVCRQVAKVLASDDVSPAEMVAANALLAQLPKAAEAKPWDLTLLTDRQLAILERLGTIARGERPAVPPHRQKSDRYWLAIELANKLDASVKGNIGEVDVPLKDLAEVRSLVMSLLSPLLTQDLFRDTFESAFAPYPVVPLPAVADNAPVAVPESARAVPKAVDNVVPLPTRHWTDLVYGGDGPPGVLFDASDPSGRRSGKP